MNFVVLLLVSYLIGSIPFGLYIGRIFCRVDLREVGSGNIGATNAWRVLGWKVAVPIFILDLAKGLVPVLLAKVEQKSFVHSVESGNWLVVGCGIASILGHNFSPFLKFKGGKGVATSLGVCIGMSWRAGVAGFGTWLVLVGLFRYVSVASIIGTAVGSAGIWIDNQKSLAFGLFGIIATTFVIVKHKANVQRLVKGTEPKVWQKDK